MAPGPATRSTPDRSTQTLSESSQNTPAVVAATNANAPACRKHQLVARRVRRLRSESRLAAYSQQRESFSRRAHVGCSTAECESARLPTSPPLQSAARMHRSAVPTSSFSASRRQSAAAILRLFHLFWQVFVFRVDVSFVFDPKLLPTPVLMGLGVTQMYSARLQTSLVDKYGEYMRHGPHPPPCGRPQRPRRRRRRRRWPWAPRAPHV